MNQFFVIKVVVKNTWARQGAKARATSQSAKFALARMERLVEQGKTNKEIGKELHLSAGTVRNYLADATQKLAASNRIEASRKARDNGSL